MLHKINLKFNREFKNIKKYRMFHLWSKFFRTLSPYNILNNNVNTRIKYNSSNLKTILKLFYIFIHLSLKDTT